MRRKASKVRLKADTTGNFSLVCALPWRTRGLYRRRSRHGARRTMGRAGGDGVRRRHAARPLQRGRSTRTPPLLSAFSVRPPCRNAAVVHESAQQRGAGGCVTCRHICPKFARSASCGRRSAPRWTSFRFSSSQRSPSFAGMHLDFCWPTKSGSARPFKPA